MVGNKKAALGQYFTKKETVSKLVELLLKYRPYGKDIKVLEPSFGTGNFIQVLKENGFNDISGCEIDLELAPSPADFFDLPLEQKYDLIIGNPPFSKYNVIDSYFHLKKHEADAITPENYLEQKLMKKSKLQIENAFILKAIKHLSNDGASLAFVLPISFFIKNKNRQVKQELSDRFSTIIIYQNDQKWFEEPIPCCFAIFTNLDELDEKIVLLYEDGKKVHETIPKSEIFGELIPRSFLFKKNTFLNGVPLSNFLQPKPAKYRKSYEKNNISASNISERTMIPDGKPPSEYNLAVVRVGNGSVGKAGLVSQTEDILNDMFYVFRFKPEYERNRNLKQKICSELNGKRDYLLNSTFRVGSKSIKKSDVLDFKVELK